MGFSDKGTRPLETARECALLGARNRTIAWITGLPPTFIRRNLFDQDHPAPRGRPPYHDEFLFRAPLGVQAEASAFACWYQALRCEDFQPAQSLITAFRHYLSVVELPSFCFDEAFYLVCSIEGIWVCSSPTLQLTPCTRCDGHHLAPGGSVATHGCPHCKLQRAQTLPQEGGCKTSRPHEPPSVSGGIAPIFSMQLQALKMQRVLADLGAHPRVVAALMSTVEGLHSSIRPAAPSHLVRIGSPLPLHNWSFRVKTLMRVQYALAAFLYRRLSMSGFTAEEAVVGAYRHVHAMFLDVSPLTFDRCFEVLSLLDARWGVAVPELELRQCQRCGAHHLVSCRDRSGPHCPFCLLIRCPNTYFPHCLTSRPIPSGPDPVRLSG